MDGRAQMGKEKAEENRGIDVREDGRSLKVVMDGQRAKLTISAMDGQTRDLENNETEKTKEAGHALGRSVGRPNDSAGNDRGGAEVQWLWMNEGEERGAER